MRTLIIRPAALGDTLMLAPALSNSREWGKTAQAILRWKRFSFDDAPPVFGNSKPKSASHLLLQILNGFTQIMPYRYVDADPIRTIKKDGGRRTVDDIVTDLRSVPQGVIGWGYGEASSENVAVLCQPSRVNYFIYPLDAVSVPFDTRNSPLFCPSSVSVHN